MIWFGPPSDIAAAIRELEVGSSSLKPPAFGQVGGILRSSSSGGRAPRSCLAGRRMADRCGGLIGGNPWPVPVAVGPRAGLQVQGVIGEKIILAAWDRFGRVLTRTGADIQ